MKRTTLPELPDSAPLSSLSADGCGLVTLPNLLRFPLRKLVVSSNRLTALPAYALPRSLEEVVLSYNPFQSALDLEHCENLESFECNSCSLLQPPRFFRNSPLYRLELYGNSISNVSELRWRTALRQLRLDGNRLTSALFLGTLARLQTVSLADNLIGELPSRLELPLLTRLDADNNQLLSLPDFTGCLELTSIRANNNLLSNASGVCSLPSLRELQLSRNRLRTFGCWDRLALPKLALLHLRRNELAAVHFGLWLGLESLDISQNKLRAIDLSYVKNLHWLNARWCGYQCVHMWC
jgi:Leucine-rich repeat (LRR) protein